MKLLPVVDYFMALVLCPAQWQCPLPCSCAVTWPTHIDSVCSWVICIVYQCKQRLKLGLGIKGIFFFFFKIVPYSMLLPA